MESFDDTFAAELRALRATPDPAFAARLDERAAAGFPRRAEGGGVSPSARLRAWFAGLTARRALVPGGAAALALVVVAVVLVGISQSGSSEQGDGQGGPFLSDLTQKNDGFKQGDRNSPEPLLEAAPSAATGGAAKAAPSVAGGAEEAAAESTGSPEFESAPVPVLPATRNRDIERSASIVLGTTPDKLSEASSRVYGAVHAARGVVLSSQVHSNKQGGEARFELLIPSGKLNAALATFSGIAEVRSRHDATADITGPTVSASEELQDSNARIESLIGQLGDAETESEREAVEGELRGERSHHAGLRASLDRLKERASMSRVSLRILSGHGAGVAPEGDSGGWGAGDALGDAGHILTVAGGVAIIGLAVVGPIALILLAIWLLNRFRVRRLRERTLG